LDLSLEALRAADTAFTRLAQFVGRTASQSLPLDTDAASATWQRQFYDAWYDDLDAPRAIAVLWCIFADASLPTNQRAQLIGELGGLIGLDWSTARHKGQPIEADVAELVAAREEARAARDFSRADALRRELASRGFAIEDSPAGPLLSRTRASA